MKKWNDLFSEEPSKQHDQNVLNNAEQMLAEIRERNQQADSEFKPSFWDKVLLPGMGLGVTAVFAVIFFKKKQVMLLQEMNLADLIEEDSDIDDLMDEDLDLDLLAELDEFEELDNSGILDKEMMDERS